MIKKHALFITLLFILSPLSAAEEVPKAAAKDSSIIISEADITPNSPNGRLLIALIGKEITMPDKTKIHHIDFEGAHKALQEGANPNVQFKSKEVLTQSILYYSVEKEQIKAVQLLLKYKADVEKGTNTGTTPLMKAASKDGSLVEELLEHRADINAVKENFGTAIHFIGSAKHPEKNIALLLAHNADIDYYPPHSRRTILHEVVERGNFKLASYLLLHADANPSIKEWRGKNVCDLVGKDYKKEHPDKMRAYEDQEKELAAFREILKERLTKEMEKL